MRKWNVSVRESGEARRGAGAQSAGQQINYLRLSDQLIHPEVFSFLFLHHQCHFVG